MWRVYLSRWANHHVFRGHPDQMLSSRVHEEDHLIAKIAIDTVFLIVRQERRHCEKTARWESRFKTAQDQTKQASTAPYGVANLSQKGGDI